MRLTSKVAPEKKAALIFPRRDLHKDGKVDAAETKEGSGAMRAQVLRFAPMFALRQANIRIAPG
jgi:hypothetical protein